MTRNPELVDATDLDAYAEQRPREAQELLPHLVRRLLANTPGVTGVSVRTGSSIGMTGYDGQAHGGAGTSFVPVGPGCGSSARAATRRRRPKRTTAIALGTRWASTLPLRPSSRSACGNGRSPTGRTG